MPKTETNIIVLLDNKPVANCAGIDIALATADGIMNKISNSPNFSITIKKVTNVIPDPEPVKEEKKVEDGPVLMDKKEEVKK